MDTIFTLLIILLPIVFKLIGKKLEKAGSQPQVTDSQQEPIEDWAEVLRRHIEVQQQEEVAPAAPVQQPPVQARTMPERVSQEGRPQTRKSIRKPAAQPKKPILQEEEQTRTEKIDKKKLIVYSEIMKPKYTE